MRKTLLFSLLFILQCLFAGAQNLQELVLPQKKIKCNTFESLQDFRSKNPNAETDAQFETWLSQKIAARQGQRTDAYYTIPVIFHIIHSGEAVGTGRNLSAAQIQQQLNQLNADFANLSGSTYGVAATTQIQFCLATVDAFGAVLPEPGIERINYTSLGFSAPPYDGFASNSYVDVTIMPMTIWDPNKFFNIWTLELSGGLLGKATFPTSSGLPGLTAGETNSHAGVFVTYESIGSLCSPGLGASSYGLGRTLTHETGHFFGLRHITGDSPCGDDFCLDTPPQDALTSGCPSAGTLNGCVPSVPKMFENYMDYTNDACVNTFTADQVTRVQTVMMNSPRRMQLPGAGSCNGPALNAIRFNYVCANASEAAVVTTCPQYRDVQVNINIQSAATGAATVNFAPTGTATNNVDYTIIPSSLSYVNGESTPKTVTIRIWDDGVVESAETLTLGYSISGAGVVAGSSNQIFTLTINDNDVTPTISNTGSAPIYTEGFSSGAPGWGVATFTGGAGNNNWTVSGNGGAGFTGNVLHITENTTTRPLTYDFFSTTSRAAITPFINASGQSNLKFSFKYKCNGELIGSTLYDYGTIVYTFDGTSYFTVTSGGNPIYLYSTPNVTTLADISLPAALNNSSFRIGFRWSNDNNGTGNNPPLAVDDVVVSVPAVGTEGEQNHTGTKNIFSSQDVYILSSNDNQVIARVNNASANIGCLTATVAQAGSGTVAITTNSGSFQRTQKVINLVPAIANSTVTHQTTLYFSSAELATWGANKLNLKILQVADGVNLAGTITGANAKVITPTSATEDVLNGVIAYTGNFTGFSQFMLVSPTFILPVNLMTFEAQPSKKSIELKWKTAQERNNKGFGIERSTNGADFSNIGFVNGVGTTDDPSSYKYSDNFVQPNTIYYYRLKQVDFDSRATLSNVRQAKIANSGLTATISPNPVKGQMTVFVSGTVQSADISLVNAKGQTVGRWSKAEVSSPYAVDVTRFAKGYYTVIIHLQEGEITKQVLLQ